MRVFMLGWEFPPFISGGLGTACYGLTRGLDKLGVHVYFVLPRPIDRAHATHVRMLSPTDAAPDDERVGIAPEERLGEFRLARFRAVDAAIHPYDSLETGSEALEAGGRAGRGAARVRASGGMRVVELDPPATGGAHYGGDLMNEVGRYASLAARVAARQDFDVIHAHDWMTYPAGIAVRNLTGKPLVAHVHSTEFDRSGMHVDQRIYDIERAGMHAATRVVAVSHLTRNVILRHYGVEAYKCDVVYNAIDEDGADLPRSLPPITRDEKIVLFLGRITMQKGPEYFLAAAKRVLEVMDNVRFVMAGSGDMIRRMIELAAQMGIGHKVLFTGFLRGDDVKRVFRIADLYVMPSVSEPFGITPLEALAQDVPVIISKQSGVAEVLRHALKVDFWDVDEMANKIVAVLRHPPLHAALRDHGSIEVARLSWEDAAANCLSVYRKAAGLA